LASKYTLANVPGTASFSNVTQTSIRANWTANSNRSGTEYWCENTTKGTNSGWTTNTYWESTGLSCGISYSFQVKAKNGDGIETGWTSLGSQSTQACPTDTTPPTPNPMTWATQPYAASSTSISMVATTATDDTSPPVSYYFDFVDSPTGGTGGADSNWQSSTSYTNAGLQPNHRYGYQVQARDSASSPNVTSPSSPVVYKYTLANAPGAAPFSNVTSTCIRANWTANGNPSGTLYLCENLTKGTNSGWTTNTSWDSCGLAGNTSYNFQVKAKNGDNIETISTSLGSQTTLPPQQEEFTFTGTVAPSRENKHPISVKAGAKSMYSKLTWSSSWVDLRLRIYNPSGVMVAEIDNSTTSNRTEETTVQLPAEGTRQVAAYSESRWFSTSYTIQVIVNY